MGNLVSPVSDEAGVRLGGGVGNCRNASDTDVKEVIIEESVFREAKYHGKGMSKMEELTWWKRSVSSHNCEVKRHIRCMSLPFWSWNWWWGHVD